MGFGDDVTRFCALARRQLPRPVATCARKQRAQRLAWAKEAIGAILGVDVTLKTCEVENVVQFKFYTDTAFELKPPTRLQITKDGNLHVENAARDPREEALQTI